MPAFFSRLVERLRPYLQNEWMNNANVLAQLAHVAWMYGIVVTFGFLVGQHAAFEAGGALALYAVVKEWIYDAHFEVPKQTWKDNLLDMSMLWLGIALAAGVVWRFAR